jgi:hypothetical protein
MKIRVTFKDPDTVHDCVRDAVNASVGDIASKRERDAVIDVRVDEAMEAIGHWVEYGDYIDVEFDTEAMTATVVPR